MPKSSHGKGSVWSIFAMFGLFFFSSLLKYYINRSISGGSALHEHLIGMSILAMLIRGGFAAGISALLNGLIGIFDQKDRGLLIYTSTIFGAAVTIYFFLGQFIPQLGFVY